MKHSKHGQKRMQQRGRKALDLRVIEKFGERRRGGLFMMTRRKAAATLARYRIWLKKREGAASFSHRAQRVREILQSVEKTVDWMAIIKNGILVTVYPADKKRQRKFMRGQCRQC